MKYKIKWAWKNSDENMEHRIDIVTAFNLQEALTILSINTNHKIEKILEVEVSQ